MSDDLFLKVLSKTEQWWTERAAPALHAMSSIGGCLATIGRGVLRLAIGVPVALVGLYVVRSCSAT